jgi:hypothetical protein
MGDIGASHTADIDRACIGDLNITSHILDVNPSRTIIANVYITLDILD